MSTEHQDERFIMIEGQRVKVTYREIPIDKVKLDPENPRIKYILGKQKTPLTPQDIENRLFEREGVNDLLKQIRDNKGLMVPIIVDQNLRVVEGNCRTAIYKKLHRAPSGPITWSKIPAFVLPPDISESQIAVLQSTYHILGKIKWPAYEKVSHLNFMRTKLSMDIPRIARVLALPEADVKSNLEAYDTMTKEFLTNTANQDGLKYWSYFQELFKNNKLAAFRKQKDNIKLFNRLVKEKKIPRGEAVRKLPTIVDNPVAMKKLKDKGMDEALKEVGKKHPEKIFPLFRHIAKTRRLLEKVSTNEIGEIRSQRTKQEELRKLSRAITKVAAAVAMELE
jgi:hypothetical protein